LPFLFPKAPKESLHSINSIDYKILTVAMMIKMVSGDANHDEDFINHQRRRHHHHLVSGSSYPE
jgi:hypothetical protein